MLVLRRLAVCVLAVILVFVPVMMGSLSMNLPYAFHACEHQAVQHAAGWRKYAGYGIGRMLMLFACLDDAVAADEFFADVQARMRCNFAAQYRFEGLVPQPAFYRPALVQRHVIMVRSDDPKPLEAVSQCERNHRLYERLGLELFRFQYRNVARGNVHRVHRRKSPL